jgi:DNA-binding IclR family transcriptional regulator
MRRLPKNPEFEAPALERGIAILRFLDHPYRDRGASAGAIMKALSLPRATLYRILKILMDADLVVQDANSGRYRLGHGLVELGFYAFRATPLAHRIQPLLHRISDATGQAAEAFVPAGRWGMLLLDCYQKNYAQALRMHRSGLYWPITHRDIHGMCYLTFDAAWRPAEYERKGATKEGQDDLWLGEPPPANWAEQCPLFRKVGYCFGRTQLWAGTSRVAVPVYKPGRPRRMEFSLGILQMSDDLDPQQAAEWGRLLMERAREFENSTR